MNDATAFDAAESQALTTLEHHTGGIAVLRFGLGDRRQNVMTTALAEALVERIAQVRADRDIRGLVLASNKSGSFLAGVDTALFDGFTEALAAEQRVRGLQAGLAGLATLKIPVVAAIDGGCIGGGLELALVCDARVAADTPATRFAMSEVKLGLVPIAGGTQRLPRLVGIDDSLDLMLTGRTLSPVQARTMGLIDAHVPADELLDTAIARARRQAKRDLLKHGSWRRTLQTRVSHGRAGMARLALEDNAPGRHLLFAQARTRSRARSGGHYPAIDRIIDVVEIGYQRGTHAGLMAEAKAFGELVTGEVSHALRHIHHAKQTLKKANFKTGNAKPHPVARLGVLGAGLMGAGIASVSLDRTGAAVQLKDVDEAGLARGRAHIEAGLARRVDRGGLAGERRDARLARLTTTHRDADLGGCDLIIEAVYEDLALKQQMLAACEAAADEAGQSDQVFASNTSSLPIRDIAARAARPENVVGMHYFSPVEKMPLLEIIATEQTSRKTLATAVALGRAQGKTVIVVRDAPGFYTTRVLSPYLNEAARLLDEGAGVRAIDDALTQAGFPVGPLTLLDEIGVDVGIKVGPILEAAFGPRMAVPVTSAALIEAGFLGRKSGAGFYDYEGAKKRGQRPVNAGLASLLAPSQQTGGAYPGAQDIVDRATMAFVNEAAHCLTKGVIADPLQGDIGAVLGLGFLPFTGGPFRYVDRIGIDHIVKTLTMLADLHGPRFTPAPVLRTMAAARAPRQRRFYA